VVSLEDASIAYDVPTVQSPERGDRDEGVPSLFVTVRFEMFTDPSATRPVTKRPLKAISIARLGKCARWGHREVVAVRLDVRMRVPAIMSVRERLASSHRDCLARAGEGHRRAGGRKVVADDVSQEPAMEMEDKPKARTQRRGFRLPLRVIVVRRVSVPDHVTLEEKVVLVPGVTMRLKIGCVSRIEPPDAFTTMVEVPP